MKFEFIYKNCSLSTVKKMCKFFEVSTSGYYTWRDRKPSQREVDDAELKIQIENIFVENDSDYGSPRITEALRDLGYKVGKNRVASLMREMQLHASKPPKFRPKTTDSDHSLPISPNLLNQNFEVEKPNLAWVSDITYIKVGQTWSYLCTMIDLFSRKVVGWSLATHMRTSMVVDALESAVQKNRPGGGLIVHSDRGTQYASQEFREKLAAYEFKSSMSRKANCYDNAVAESFFKTIKKEEIYKRNYSTYDEARTSIFGYIETYYNSRRKHSFLNYKSPVQFEELHAA